MGLGLGDPDEDYSGDEVDSSCGLCLRLPAVRKFWTLAIEMFDPGMRTATPQHPQQAVCKWVVSDV